MSALGQKQTFAVQKVMSALPLIAYMCSALGDVRFVPEADIREIAYGTKRPSHGRSLCHFQKKKPPGDGGFSRSSHMECLT